MTNPEFSAQFEVLWNGINSNSAPGLNEAEKSVFLTKAEHQLVSEYFNTRTDGVGGGFDGSQKRQYDFSSLIRVENLFYLNTFKDRISDMEKLDKRSKVYLFPQSYYLAVNELLSDSKRQYSVIPLDYSEYQRLMLKPYNFPVKKGAWRMITDKKNCNFCHESYKKVNDKYTTLADDDNTAVADYKILTSWADQKRTLSLFIIATDDVEEGSTISTSVATFTGKGVTLVDRSSIKLYFSKTWDSTHLVYKIGIGIAGIDDGDGDEAVIDYLKNYFSTYEDNSAVIKDVITHLDGMAMCSAPSEFTTFFTGTGRIFETHNIQIPLVEVIGKFEGIPTYQMRFVRKLTPIILDDLSDYGEDMSIDGYKTKMECMLPEECHQEILERAVTLAKIAWQGGTITQAAAQQRKNE